MHYKYKKSNEPWVWKNVYIFGTMLMSMVQYTNMFGGSLIADIGF